MIIGLFKYFRLIHRLADKPVQQAYVEHLTLTPVKDETPKAWSSSPNWGVDWCSSTSSEAQWHLASSTIKVEDEPFNDKLPYSSESNEYTTEEWYTSDSRDTEISVDASIHEVNKRKLDNESPERKDEIPSSSFRESLSDDHLIPVI